MYLEIFLVDFAVFRVLPEFRGSATARNIRSSVLSKVNHFILKSFPIQGLQLKQ